MGKKKITISKIKQDRIRQVSPIKLGFRASQLSRLVSLLTMLSPVPDHLLQAQEGTSEEGNGVVSPLRRQSVSLPVRQAVVQQIAAFPVRRRGRLRGLPFQRLLQP